MRYMLLYTKQQLNMTFAEITSIVNIQALTLIFTIFLSDISKPVAKTRQTNVVIQLTTINIHLLDSTDLVISKHNNPNNALTNSASVHLIQLIFIYLMFCVIVITCPSQEFDLRLPNWSSLSST